MSFLPPPRRSQELSTVVCVLIFCGVVLLAVFVLIVPEQMASSLGIPVRFVAFHPQETTIAPILLPSPTPEPNPTLNTTALQRVNPVVMATPVARQKDKAAAIARRQRKAARLAQLAPRGTPAVMATPVSKTPPQPLPKPAASPTPALKHDPSAKPVAPSKPTQAPTATPVPRLSVAMISRAPAWWPKQVTLAKATDFPILISGREVGKVQVPAGNLLRLWQVADGRVDVEYQGSRVWIPADATDVVIRATILSQAAPSPTPTPRPELGHSPAASTPAERSPSPSPSATPARNQVRFADRVTIEVIRNRKAGSVSSSESKEEVVLKVKLLNNDSRNSFETMKGEIYLFSENISNRNQLRLLGSQTFDFSLAVRGHFELLTDPVSVTFEKQTNEARAHGFRYDGWFLRIRDAGGAVVAERANPQSLIKLSDKIEKIPTETEFDRTTGKPPQ